MKVITAALLFLLTIPSLAAQARIQKSEEDTPFEGMIFDCIDGDRSKPLLEPVAIIGSAHSTFQITENANMKSVSSQSSIRGKAIGLITKTEYSFNSRDSFRTTYILEGQNLEEGPLVPGGSIYRSRFNIPGLYRVHYLFHVKFDEEHSEVPKLSVTNLRVRCPTIDFP